MVPTAQGECKRRAKHIGKNVKGIKVAAVGKKTLDDFAPDPKTGGYTEQCEMGAAAARSLINPVEGYLMNGLQSTAVPSRMYGVASNSTVSRKNTVK